MDQESQLPPRANEGIQLARTGAALVQEDRHEEASRYFAEARRAFQDAASLLSDTQYRVFLGRTTGELAVVRELVGDRKTARALYEQALSLLVPLGPGVEAILASIQLNFGDYLRDEGELGAARDHLEEAIAGFERAGDDEESLAARANAAQKLGKVLLDQGDLQRAFDWLALARSIHQQLGDARAAAVAEADIGRVHFAARDLDSAKDSWERSLKVFEELDPTGPDVGYRLNSLGEVAYYQQRLADAADLFARARNAHRLRAAGEEDEAIALYNLGVVHHLLGEPDQSAREYEEAIAIYDRLDISTGRGADVLASLGSVFQDKGDLDRAIATLRRSLDVTESIRAHAGAEQEREMVFAGQQAPYPRLIDCLFERGAPGDHEEAFVVAERSRARILAELLAERAIRVAPDTLAQRELLAQERALRADLSANRRKRAAARAGAAADEGAGLRTLIDEQHALEGSLDRVLDNIRVSYPAYAALEYPAPVDLREARSQLEEDTLLLEFEVARNDTLDTATVEDAVFVWALRSDGGCMLKLGVTGTELRALVDRVVGPLLTTGDTSRDARIAFASGPAADEGEATARLSDALLGPIPEAMWRRVRNVIVVPDGRLHYLPFDLLLAPGRDRVLLGDCVTLCTAPSVTVLDVLRRSWTATDPALEFVGFGDPRFVGEQETGSAGHRYAALGMRLTRLEESGREVETIAQQFGARARHYVRDDVTEARIRAEAPNARFVHFATHGLIDDEEPLYSALALSRPTAAELSEDPDLDDLLEAHEMFSLRLAAEVVVCSACRTGLGRVNAGEGMVGMTRALLFAGARSVVVSLWSVDDHATADLMLAFYRHLAAGKPVAPALRSAKADTRVDWPDARNWAAFQVIGLGW